MGKKSDLYSFFVYLYRNSTAVQQSASAFPPLSLLAFSYPADDTYRRKMAGKKVRQKISGLQETSQPMFSFKAT
jgi:hypothetical protein